MTHPQSHDPYKWYARGLGAVFFLTLPAIVLAINLLKPPPPVNPWAAAADSLGVTPATLSRGSAVYAGTCITCHGADATGIPRLGKPLRNSTFVQTSTNDQLFALIVEGRLPTDPANTTGVPMPPRGAQGLMDYQIRDVVQYLRTLQEPGAPTASLEPWILPPPPPPPPAPAPAAAAKKPQSATGSEDLIADSSGGPPEVAPEPSEPLSSATQPPAGTGVPASSAPGVATFVTFCSACHGPDGGGLPNLGKPLNTSAFVRSKTDKDLMTFIKTGRPLWDPENTTGLDMPPKGGNPALNDDQITEIISFIRAIQG